MVALRKTLLKIYDDIFVIALIMFSGLGLLFIPLKLYTLSSLCLKLLSITIFVWFFIKIIFSVKYLIVSKPKITFLLKKNNFIFLLAIISIILTFVSIVISAKGRPLSFSFFTKFLIFSETIITIALFYTIKISKIPLYILFWLSFFTASLIFVLWFTGYAKAYEGYSKWKLLTLNYSSANLAGIVMFSLSILLLSGFFYFRKWIAKILMLIPMCLSLFLYYLTSSRASLIAFAISIIFFFIWYICKKRKPTLFVSATIPLLPLLIAVVYFIFYAYYLPNGAYSEAYDIVIFGKYLGSRYLMWEEAFIRLSSPVSFLFGDYYNCCLKYSIGAFQYHNGMLDLLVSYGLVPFVSVLLLIIYLLYKMLDDYKPNLLSSFCGIILYFTSFLIGINESAPFNSSNGIFVLWFASILLIRFPNGNSLFEDRYNRKLKTDEKGGVILITNVYGTGSIGKIVQNCHLDNLNKNIISYVIYGRGEQNDDPNTLCIENYWDVLIGKLIRLITGKQWMGNYLMTYEIIDCIKNIKPNVVHIHAVNDDFMNYKILFSYLSKNKIKTVYTNHSEWMYVGSCGGHAYTCTEYIHNKCVNCIKKIKHSKETLLLKYNLINSFDKECLYITSVSPWLNNRSSKSYVMEKNNNIAILDGNDINNYLDLSLKKKEFLTKYGIGTNCKIALFVTPSLSNPLKGFKYIIQLAEINPNIDFIVLSLVKYDTKNLPNNIKVVFNVNNKSELASFYYCSDVTLLVSEQETFSMPVAESLSCGTPVVGFKAGGPESICIPKYCNFVDYGDLDMLNSAMHECFNKKINKNNLIKIAKEKYSVQTMAQNYRDVYSLLDKYYYLSKKITKLETNI